TLGLSCEHETRAHELPVEKHRARAALPLLARVLRTRKAEPLAQGVEEAFAFPDIRLALLAVDLQFDPHTRHLSSARRVRMRSACRLYRAVPRTSSIGLAASDRKSTRLNSSHQII